MSRRGPAAKRQKNDNYSSPPWCVRRLIESGVLPSSGRWLEPCAGDGVIIETVRTMLPAVEWSAVELRFECTAKLATMPLKQATIGDFLQVRPERFEARDGYADPFDVVLTNPPYSLAQQFIDHALLFAPIVCMLLRLNFLASEGRADTSLPGRIKVLPNRPCFVSGASDSCEYGWFVYSREPGPCVVERLAVTPLAERRPKGVNARAPRVKLAVA